MKRLAFVVSLAVSVLLAGCMHSGTLTCTQYPDGHWDCAGGAQGAAQQPPVATPGL